MKWDIFGAIGVGEIANGQYRVDLINGTRLATDAEILDAVKLARIESINAECRARPLARFGPPEEQVSRSLGIYGASEQSVMVAGIAACIDASNEASNAVIAAFDVKGVEAVTVTWPIF